MNQTIFSARFLLINAIFLIIPFFVFGQSYNISGTVKDSDRIPLPSATVFIQSPADSTVVDYTISDDDGKFTLKGRTIDKAVDFYVSYTGYGNYHKALSLEEESDYDLGDIILKELTSTLDEVLIRGTAPPITLKKDTLEFNVSSFKTKEDASLEDLLKKLPGVTVDRDGNIKVNGMDVTKIKVNGKDFFGDDPKIATKNLPKDLIQKIQVVDSKTKSQEFTKEESQSDDKMINLIIDEDDNKGLFARLTAGIGTDDRFSVNGIANFFKNDMRLSLLGSANNINSIGFSYDEIFDAMGRNAYSVINAGSNAGITKSHSAGLDFVDELGENLELSANYFYNRASSETESVIERENILPGRHYFNNSNSVSKNVNNNHRANFDLEYKPDTLTRITYRPMITVNNGFSESYSSAESFDQDGLKLNESETSRNGKSDGTDFSNRLDYTRRYGDKGGFFRFNVDLRNDKDTEDRANFTSRDLYNEDGSLQETSIQDQRIKRDDKGDELSVGGRVRIPLDEKWKVDVDYRYKNSTKTSERLIYETADNGINYDILNEELSSDFKFRTQTHTPMAGLVYTGEKLRAGVFAGLESVNMKNEEYFTNTLFDNTFNNLFGRVFMRYRLNQSETFFFRFMNNRSLPSVTQLQPVTNTTNPLNIVTGNPNLKPALVNRFSLNYYNFNFKTQFGTFVYLSGQFDKDQIVAKTFTDEELVRTTTYTNVDGKYNLNLGASIHKQFKFADEYKSTIKPELELNAGLRRDVGFSNEVRFNSETYTLSPSVSLEYDIPDIINVKPSYRVSYNQTEYSLDSRRDQEYTDHDLGLEVTTYWPEKLVFGSDITYTRLGKTAPGFDKDFVLWNLSLGYKLLGDDGILKVTVFDLLNQNISNRRITGEDYVQDMQQLVLKRYAMLTFTYKFSKFGGKKARQGGGMRYRRMG